MDTLVRLVDETPSGVITEALTLRLIGESITVRELIRRRVEAEVTLHNADRAEASRDSDAWATLVTPEAERTLNGDRVRKPVDPEQQVRIAHEAFRRNGFFVLFQDRQVESLDDEVLLSGDATVSFLRLMPLVGG